ncbi:O-antigen ligase family protein [Azospirillum sp. sgz301742]
MPTVDPLIATAIVLLLAGLWIVWWTRLRGVSGPPLATSGRVVSWAVVIVYFTWKTFFYEPREDVLELVNSGMSDSNRIEVAITAVSGLWAAWLVFSQRMPFMRLVQGAGFWIVALVALYSLSTLWSVWRDLTLYKSLELGIYWVITAHLFATGAWRDTLERLALWAVIGGLLPPIVQGTGPETGVVARGAVVGAFYSNGSALMAGALLLIALHRLLTRRDLTAKALTVFALVSLLLFHSFTTYLSVVLALPALFVLVLMPRATPMATAVMICGIVGAGVSIAYLAAHAEPHLVAAIGGAAGKDADQIGSMTGRLPLWEALWEVSKDKPFGTGFLAMERMIPEIISQRAVGWSAAHSHNGFLSAWLAAGFLGIGVLVFFTVALFFQIVGQDADARALAIPFVLFVLVNNMSFPAFGGRLNGAWLMIMGVAFATSAVRVRPVQRAEPRAPAVRWGGRPALPHRGG